MNDEDELSPDDLALKEQVRRQFEARKQEEDYPCDRCGEPCVDDDLFKVRQQGGRIIICRSCYERMGEDE